MNKKNALLIFAVLSAYFNAYTQNDEVFSTLNRSYITTGSLFDKAIHFTDWDKLTGTSSSDTIGSYKIWKQVYTEYYNSIVENTDIPSVISVNNTISSYRNNNNVVPLLFINIRYNQIKDYAFNNNLLKLQDGKLYHGSNLSESPYHEKAIFTMAPALEKLTESTVNFLLKKEFFYTQNNNYPTSVQIDFGDGSGYRSISWDQTVTISYNSNLFSGGKITVKARIQSGSTTLNASASMKGITCTAPYSPDLPPWNLNPAPLTNPFLVEATIPYNGIKGKGNIYFKYRKNVLPGETGKLNKPIIFVEGVDFGEMHGRAINGDLGWCEFMGGDQEVFPELKDMSVLIEELRNKGYDIVIIDFYDGADYMQRNALLLVEVIQRIQNYKLGPSQNVIVGASMGGQIARYALAYMEKNNLKHCTREFISFDSPQKGANIPLGLQYMLDFFSVKGPKLVNADFLEQCEKKLNRPAAKQLLVTHYNNPSYPGNNSPNDAASLHQEFYNELASMGNYPTNLRKVAIANGSGNSTGQGYNSGDQILKWRVTSLCINSPVGKAEVFSPGNENIIFNGRIVNSLAALACQNALNPLCGPCFDLFSNSKNVYCATNSQPYDNCPGGARPSIIDAEKSINEVFPKWMPKFQDAKAIYPNHAFIPATSALGINTNDLFFNIRANIVDPDNPHPLYAFEAYYTPFNKNQQHVFVDVNYGGGEAFGYNTTAGGNGEWAFKEILQNENTLPSTLNSSSPNSGVYNYGRKQSRFLNSIVIGSGGKLYVNAKLPTDFGAATNPLPPGGTITPVDGSMLPIETCYCDPIVDIQDNGEFTLGQASPNNKAIVYFRRGSTLIIRNNGRLIINDNSILVIEEGAKLIYEAGAQIQLLGDNAVLDIKGELQLGSNADFTFTYPGYSSGYIKFSSTVFPSQNVKTLGTGAKFTLNGTSRTDQVLDISQETLYLPDNLYQFKLSNGAATLQRDGRISPGGLGTIIYMDNFWITSNNGIRNAHRGLTIFGQPNVTINNCIFEKGKYGIYAYLAYGGASLTVSNSSFNNCDYGIYSYSAGLTLNNCSFNANTTPTNMFGPGYGWYGEVMSAPCTINNCNFGGTAGNTRGLFYRSSTGELRINNSIIANNVEGVDVENASVSFKCSNFHQNISAGLYGGKNSRLLMDKTISGTGSQVIFTGNNINIQLDRSNWIFLDGGYNQLVPGSSANPKSIYGTIETCQQGIAIAAHKNKWFSTGGFSSDFYNVRTISPHSQFCDYPITLTDNTPVKCDITCGSFPPNPPCQIIGGGGLGTMAPNEIEEVLNERDEPKNVDDFKRIIELSIIALKSGSQNTNDEEVNALKKFYPQLLSAISALAENSRKEKKSIQLYEKLFNDILSMMDHEINRAVIRDDAPVKFFTTIDKAFIHRLKGNLDKSINLLNEAVNMAQEDDIEYVERLICLFTNEKKVKDGSLAKEAFSDAIQTCQTAFNQRNFIQHVKTNEETTSEKQTNFHVYPNPNNGLFSIAFNLSDSEYVRIEVVDITGKTIFNITDNKSYQAGYHKFEVNTGVLDNGIYFIRLQTRKENFIKRITVIK